MLRYSQDEYQALQSRIHASLQRKAAVPVKTEPQGKAAAKQGGRRNKYGAQATEISGIRFDSKAEAKRYIILKAMEQAGEISSLKLQTEFQIFPAQNIDGHKIRPCFYRCDFEYIDSNGKRVVEDVKSGPTKTAEYKIKAKAVAFFHGIIIREVLMD